MSRRLAQTTPCVTPPGPDPQFPTRPHMARKVRGELRRSGVGLPPATTTATCRRLHKSPPPLWGHAEKAQDCEEVQGIPRRAQKRTETRNADSPTYIPRQEDTPEEGGAAEGEPLKEPPGATIWQAQRTRERGQRRETLKCLNRLTERGLREARQKLTHSDEQPQRTPHR